jgi:hypothetical protein
MAVNNIALRPLVLAERALVELLPLSAGTRSALVRELE